MNEAQDKTEMKPRESCIFHKPCHHPLNCLCFSQSIAFYCSVLDYNNLRDCYQKPSSRAQSLFLALGALVQPGVNF